MRIPLALRISCLAMLMIAAARGAAAGPPGKPGTSTCGPPVTLGADQMRAIASKGMPQTPAAPPAPATRVVNGKVVPVPTPTPLVSVTRADGAVGGATPGAREAAALHKPLKLPTISPAIGAIPRPEWSHPYELSKQQDLAVIGSQRVTVSASPSSKPATNAKGERP